LEEETVKQVIIGCAKSVLLAESQWYRKRLRPRKPSQKQVDLALTLWPSLSSSRVIPEFRAFPSVRERLAKIGLDKVLIDHPDVNRALKCPVNIGYFQKQAGMPMNDGRSGRNIVYTETDFVVMLKKLVSKLKHRAVIYSTLRLSHILERYLRVCHYVGLIRCKRIDVKNAVKLKRIYALTPILESEIEEYEKVYIEDQETIKKKSNDEIFSVACLKAKNDLHDKLWHSDIGYTRFFINGGKAYDQIQIVMPKS